MRPETVFHIYTDFSDTFKPLYSVMQKKLKHIYL